MSEINLDPLLRKKKDKVGHPSENLQKKQKINKVNKEKDDSFSENPKKSTNSGKSNKEKNVVQSENSPKQTKTDIQDQIDIKDEQEDADLGQLKESKVRSKEKTKQIKKTRKNKAPSFWNIALIILIALVVAGSAYLAFFQTVPLPLIIQKVENIITEKPTDKSKEEAVNLNKPIIDNKSTDKTTDNLKKEIVNLTKTKIDIQSTDKTADNIKEETVNLTKQTNNNKSSVKTTDKLKEENVNSTKTVNDIEKPSKQDIDKQELDCDNIQLMLQKQGFAYREKLIQTGVAEKLIIGFEKGNTSIISPSCLKVLSSITIPDDDSIGNIFIKRKSFSALLKLFSHSDINITEQAIKILYSIIVKTRRADIPNTNKDLYFTILNETGGIKDIIELFNSNRSQYSRDLSALCIGILYEYKSVKDEIVKPEILEQILTISQIGDNQIKTTAQQVHDSISRNKKDQKKNSNEIDLEPILQDLKQPLEGTKEDIKRILHDQDSGCQIISQLIHRKQDNETIQGVINSGVIQQILKILENRDVEDISLSLPETVYLAMSFTGDEIVQQVIDMKPYGGFFRLFDHSNLRVKQVAISSIYALLLTGARQSQFSQIHPHVPEIQQYTGNSKLYELFQKESDQFLKDLSAVCIGLMYQMQEIQHPSIKQDIIRHLKTILSSNPYLKEISFQALKGLANNQKNFQEIMRDVDFDDIAEDLNIKQIGNQEQINKIKSLQIKHCLLLSALLDRKKATEMRQNIIDSGIVNALLRILDTQPINSIASEYVHALFNMIVYSSDLLMKQIYEMNALPILLKFVNHTDMRVQSDTTFSLIQMLLAGARSDNINKIHPYFNSLHESGGIIQLIDLFKTSKNRQSVKETSAMCLGIIFKGQKIADSFLREEVIKQLQNIAADVNPVKSEAAKYALENLIIVDEDTAMDHASEYNVDGGLLSLGEFIFLELLSEMELPQDVRQFLILNKKTYKLILHPRFARIIQSIIQIRHIFIIKEAQQGSSDGNTFFHSNKNEWCTIAIDPIISEGLVKIEVMFENTGGWDSRIIGFADASCSFAVSNRPSDDGNRVRTVRYYRNGDIGHVTDRTIGNQKYANGQRIGIEVDMTTIPRKVTFFVDDDEQPNVVIGIPEAIRFWAFTLQDSSYFTVTKFERLIQSTAKGVEGSKALEWGKEWK
ncbi:MAG: hypothetical protein EZS28_006537 [Streblomastix strix]|uniref:SPRY domain-containing protein n=1 Tax=Streblomastix strix TaxID=222440 RepID=A0A5J4WSN6_9EUKA|nr:MAG: hypothetical protein EZS28_006537 [Streblomastix strix]